jgi:hypothetical protein
MKMDRKLVFWLPHVLSAARVVVEADLAMKKKALQGLASPKAKPLRFRPKYDLLWFLKSL